MPLRNKYVFRVLSTDPAFYLKQPNVSISNLKGERLVGRGVGPVAVAAGAAAAEAVAVDFVDDIEGAVPVCEAGWVDGAALAVYGWEVQWDPRKRGHLDEGRLTLRDRRRQYRWLCKGP